MNFKNKIEQLDTREIIESKYINWEFFQNKTVLVTGATGLIGTQIVKALLYANEELRTNINIIALARNKNKVNTIFGNTQCDKIKFIYQDIEKRLNYSRKVDYIIHTANSTSSASFVNKPVETISSIVQGTKNILDFARKVKAKSIVYLSSMEVYGEIPVSRQEPLTENEYGYVDILKPRSSYQEGKRTAECLCSAYAHEYGVPVKIARLAQTIGAGVDYNDNRVFAQFARNIVEQQDIVLKTKGETIRSYCYITDAVTAILSMLEKGNNGESYNVANPETTCSIMDMAKMLCEKYPSSKLVVNVDDRNFPSTTKYYLSTTKYHNKSGWNAIVDLKEAYSRLISSFTYQETIVNKSTPFKEFLQHIFYLRNNGDYKILTILGLNIKMDIVSINRAKFSKLPIKNNRIVLNNFGGKGYGCNLKYIAEEIIRRNLPYEILWLCKDERDIRKNGLPLKIKTTGFKNTKGLKAMFTTKIIISNVHLNNLIAKGWLKSNEQKYIQTWHGSLGIKKIDYSVKNNDNAFFTSKWHKLTDTDIKMTDYLISNSEFEKNVFKEGLLWNKPFLETGHPRNDIFFKDTIELEKIRKKVFDKFKIDYSKKVILYAPSFRDDKRLDVYNLDYKFLLETLKQNLGNNWIIMVRLHPQLVSSNQHAHLFKTDKDIIDASYYSDIQELLVATDIGITDYSSWIFDFMLSRKPAFIYAEDIKKYNTERGFYYPLESTPFPVAKNNAELAENIKNFDYNKYRNEVEKFLKEKGCMEDGHASERVVDLIEEIINNAE